MLNGLDTASGLGRDVGPYSTRNSSKGSLIAEAHLAFRALASGKSVGEVRSACLGGKLLRQAARETRHRIWESLHWRFFSWAAPSWVLADMAAASRSDVTSPWFVGLVYLHFARRDRLTFDFVAEKLWPLWKGGARDVRRDDVIDFLGESVNGQPTRWRESTRVKAS